MFTDTHCHLNMIVKKTFDAALNAEEVEAAHDIILEAKKYQVTKIINVGTSLIESENCIVLARKYENVYASVGIHPNDAQEHWQEEFNVLKKHLTQEKNNTIVAIGECGIDFHYPKHDKERQQKVFFSHIELALEHDLPLIVHSRDAAEETLKCLQKYQNGKLRGTIHCFSYDYEFARKAIDLGFVLGIGGTITYPKNNTLRAVVKEVGIEHIILETDAPFLPPQIIRGRTNYPRYIEYIAQYIGELLGISIQTISDTTQKNVYNLFRI